MKIQVEVFLYLVVFKKYNVYFQTDFLHMSRSRDTRVQRMFLLNSSLFSDEFVVLATLTCEMVQSLGESHKLMATHFKDLKLTVPCLSVSPRLQRI